MRAVAGIALIAAYPPTIHLLVASGRADLATGVLLAACLVSVFLMLRDPRRSWKWIAGCVVFAAIGIASFLSGSTIAMRVPPVAINIMLAVSFAASLATGRTPVMERVFATSVPYRSELSAAARSLARSYTRQWVGIFTAMAVAAALLAMLAPIAVWSLFTNIVYFALILLLALLQHGHRVMRLGRGDGGSMRLFFRRLAMGAWHGSERASGPQ